MTTTRQDYDHTCYGRIFCGAPKTTARAECPACIDHARETVAEDRGYYDTLLDSVPNETEDLRS